MVIFSILDSIHTLACFVTGVSGGDMSKVDCMKSLKTRSASTFTGRPLRGWPSNTTTAKLRFEISGGSLDLPAQT
ncbi:hypothetical protein B0J17DRAFT_279522 [Rhizoctonia solani]|nr:hypothetical protein B0J17DRAFT_279522 [Rhizoctonia solani]